jgi:PRC-barrel domain
MAAFDPATLDRWRALAIVDRDGSTVGTISEFYLDRETGHPTWALVNTGLFGTTQTFVPLVHATEISDGLQVPYEKRHIKDSPRVDLHDELSPDEEATLFAYYGVEYQLRPTDAEARPVDTERGPDEALDPFPAGAALTGSPAAADPEPGAGEPPGPVPADPGSVDTEPGPAPAASTEPVPDEPGTTGDGTTPVGTGDGAEPADGVGSRVEHPEDTGISEGTATPQDTAIPEHPADPDLAGTWPGSSTGLDSSQAGLADPDLSRTAPVAHGLPGSTAASPYGFGPPTIDKDADPSELLAEEPSRPPAEAGWAPGAAGSFEEQHPVDGSASASDHWREAKAAAERERIARAAAQPEERSPFERARRRLERLVGGGQDHPDPEDISPADRDAAERARLGLDEEDHRRKR